MKKGISEIARATGKMFGIVGRIRIPMPSLPKKEGDKPSGLLKRKTTERDDLAVEIERIERELDQVYDRVVRGAGSVKRSGAETPELSALLQSARDLKEMLDKKRAELFRIRRDAAREKRMQGSLSPANGFRAERRGPAAKSAEPRRGGAGEAVNARMRKILIRAARRASFSDNAQRVVFEKAIQDLMEEDAEIRRAAASRLGNLKGPETLEALSAALDDTSETVRAAALNSLALLGETASAGLFIRFINHPDPHLRLASLRGLAKIEGDPANQALAAGLEDEDAAVRKGAATYLGWRKDKTHGRALARALYDEDKAVRAAAAASLGNLHEERAVLSLIRALRDASHEVREASQKALEAVLGKPLNLDVSNRPDAFDPKIEELKDWWKKARVDRQVYDDVALPDFPETAPVMAAEKKEPEPQPAVSAEKKLAEPEAALKTEAKTVEPEHAVAAEEKAARPEPAGAAAASQAEGPSEGGLDFEPGLGNLGAVMASASAEPESFGLDDLDLKVAGLGENIEGLAFKQAEPAKNRPKTEEEAEAEAEAEFESLLGPDLPVVNPANRRKPGSPDKEKKS